MPRRVFLIVLDSFGIGGAADAARYGDEGSNTLAALLQSEKFQVPNLAKLGLFHIEGPWAQNRAGSPTGGFGRLVEVSAGKDTTTGHWEMAGLINTKPMPTYPDGLPGEMLHAFEERIGRGTLCGLPYSGTKVIEDYGKEHMDTGYPIVYTSADSVFQVAAHEEVIPVPVLYEMCEEAREMLQGPWALGRVIARPFKGQPGSFKRTERRHDFSLPPPGKPCWTLWQGPAGT